MSSPLHSSAAAVIARLNLQPLPHEGGYFARTWTSRETLPNGRPVGTAIYFLLTPEGFSAMHRVDADELWHFHAGDPVEHLQLLPATEALPTAPAASPRDASILLGSADVPIGPERITRLGTDLATGELPQLTVPAGIWQGARLAQNARRGWALLSCTMSPGWDDSGFELATRDTLHARYPAHSELISALTRTD
jgi:uncharacterized protein